MGHRECLPKDLAGEPSFQRAAEEFLSLQNPVCANGQEVPEPHLGNSSLLSPKALLGSRCPHPGPRQCQRLYLYFPRLSREASLFLLLQHSLFIAPAHCAISGTRIIITQGALLASSR